MKTPVVFFVLAVSLAVAVVACSSPAAKPDCEAIAERCHEVATSANATAAQKECHEQAESAWSNADCLSHKASCEAICPEEPRDGGQDAG